MNTRKRTWTTRANFSSRPILFISRSLFWSTMEKLCASRPSFWSILMRCGRISLPCCLVIPTSEHAQGSGPTTLTRRCLYFYFYFYSSIANIYLLDTTHSKYILQTNSSRHVKVYVWKMLHHKNIFLIYRFSFFIYFHMLCKYFLNLYKQEFEYRNNVV